MPHRLLREPHLLAHELRTPLGILAGWISLARDGDIHPDRTPRARAAGMQACAEAAARLNLIIEEGCQEGVDHPHLDRVQVPSVEHCASSTLALIS